MRRAAVVALALAGCAANPAPRERAVPVVDYASGPPALVLSASPRVGLPPLTVSLRAVLNGLEDERWYCRPIEWTWPDGTRSTQSADCAPWAEHTPADYERVWTKRIVLGVPGAYVFRVALLKTGGGTLAASDVTVEVGGER